MVNPSSSPESQRRSGPMVRTRMPSRSMRIRISDLSTAWVTCATIAKVALGRTVVVGFRIAKVVRSYDSANQISPLAGTVAGGGGPLVIITAPMPSATTTAATPLADARPERGRIGPGPEPAWSRPPRARNRSDTIDSIASGPDEAGRNSDTRQQAESAPLVASSRIMQLPEWPAPETFAENVTSVDAARQSRASQAVSFLAPSLPKAPNPAKSGPERSDLRAGWWRRRRESNPCTRFCRPLPNHSGTSPLTRTAGCPARIRTSVNGSKVRCPTTRRRGNRRVRG